MSALDFTPSVPLSPAATAVIAAAYGSCRYPTAHDDEFRFCGEPVARRKDGKPSSYCACHRRLAITGTVRMDREVRS